MAKVALEQLTNEESSKEMTRVEDAVQLALEMGSFVGGRKLEGPGARTAIPTAEEIDATLGQDLVTVATSLKKLLGSFHGSDEGGR